MPQLSSGRHVALSASPYLDALNSDKDESRYFAIVALRLHASTPEALRDHLVIGYFVDGEGTPPDAPSYNAGYCVADVLEGLTDWSADEVEEFRHFLAHEPRFGPWLQKQFDDINHAIGANPVWRTALLWEEDDAEVMTVASIKRAIIQKPALESGAMEHMRVSGRR